MTLEDRTSHEQTSSQTSKCNDHMKVVSGTTNTIIKRMKHMITMETLPIFHHNPLTHQMSPFKMHNSTKLLARIRARRNKLINCIMLSLMSLVLILSCNYHGTSLVSASMSLPDGIQNILGFVPQSSFQCERDGYFGDIENDCRLFHLCQRTVNSNGHVEWRHWTYACGNQTMFNQLTLTCAFVDEAIPCKHASQFQYLNEVIHRPREPFLTDADVTSGFSYYSNRIMSDGARARAFEDSTLMAQLGGAGSPGPAPASSVASMVQPVAEFTLPLDASNSLSMFDTNNERDSMAPVASNVPKPFTASSNPPPTNADDDSMQNFFTNNNFGLSHHNQLHNQADNSQSFQFQFQQNNQQHHQQHHHNHQNQQPSQMHSFESQPESFNYAITTSHQFGAQSPVVPVLRTPGSQLNYNYNLASSSFGSQAELAAPPPPPPVPSPSPSPVPITTQAPSTTTNTQRVAVSTQQITTTQANNSEQPSTTTSTLSPTTTTAAALTSTPASNRNQLATTTTTTSLPLQSSNANSPITTTSSTTAASTTVAQQTTQSSVVLNTELPKSQNNIVSNQTAPTVRRERFASGKFTTVTDQQFSSHHKRHRQAATSQRQTNNKNNNNNNNINPSSQQQSRQSQPGRASSNKPINLGNSQGAFALFESTRLSKRHNTPASETPIVLRRHIANETSTLAATAASVATVSSTTPAPAPAAPSPSPAPQSPATLQNDTTAPRQPSAQKLVASPRFESLILANRRRL